jgi:hypothetical protein
MLFLDRVAEVDRAVTTPFLPFLWLLQIPIYLFNPGLFCFVCLTERDVLTRGRPAAEFFNDVDSLNHLNV